MSSYCDLAPGHPFHGPYHDTEYGFPQTDEPILFERLCLEIFQAGLSWELILKRRQGMRQALFGFDVDRIAALTPEDQDRLLLDERLIRNRLKIAAIVKNARTVQSLRHSHGGFSGWLLSNHPKSLADWVKAFKTTFSFTGPQVVNEFLMSVALLEGAHRPECPVSTVIKALPDPWQAC